MLYPVVSENWKNWHPKRGEIYIVDLGENLDCEQNGKRPFLILSNNIGNYAGSIVVGIPITSKNKPLAKIHVNVGGESGLKLNSYILTEHIRSISKRRFFYKNFPVKVGELTKEKLLELQRAIEFELGFYNCKNIR